MRDYGLAGDLRAGTIGAVIVGLGIVLALLCSGAILGAVFGLLVLVFAVALARLLYRRIVHPATVIVATVVARAAGETDEEVVRDRDTPIQL